MRKNIKFLPTGFTLIELMLVCILILVLVSISTPLFKRTYEDLRITTSAKELASVMRFCREKAIFERNSYRLILDSDEKTYKVFQKDDKDNKYKPLKSRWGKIFRIPNSISLESKEDQIDFMPNGSSTSASIYLANREGTTYTISIEKRTGFVRVYESRKE
ncbi:Tfp pilus assembly protein FimT/FimU [Candidatus Omnitrophota bacterium]